MIPTKLDRMRERAARNLPAPDPSDVLRQYGLVFAEAGKNLGDNIRKLGESLQRDPTKITVGHPVGPRIHEDTHDEPADQPVDMVFADPMADYYDRPDEASPDYPGDEAGDGVERP